MSRELSTEARRVWRHYARELARRLGFDRLPVGAYIFWPHNEGPLVPYAPQSIAKMFRTLAGEGGPRPHQLRHFSVTQLVVAILDAIIGSGPIIDVVRAIYWIGAVCAPVLARRLALSSVARTDTGPAAEQK